jgi:hypothetical protein
MAGIYPAAKVVATGPEGGVEFRFLESHQLKISG